MLNSPIRKRWAPLASTPPSRIAVALIMSPIYARTGMTQDTVPSATAVSIFTTDPITRQGGSCKKISSRLRSSDGEG